LRTIAAGIFCKTPAAGLSKTRLSPPLRADECAALSACFIRDVAATIGALAREGGVTGYAAYTPVGSEQALRTLLPPDFRLVSQGEGDFGTRLFGSTRDMLAAGHAGAILINSDSPTLPLSILRAAADALRRDDAVVLGPALDGGYTLIGLSKAHARIFSDIPWSTPQVYARTVERAREMRLPVVNVPQWYDIDDEDSLRLLESELAGEPLPFKTAGHAGAEARATRQFFAARTREKTKEAAWTM
jgi:rSAM/selenodomain-associated transferase 1